MKYPKRDLLADVSRSTGITRAILSLPQKPVLLVLNYHRIGDPSQSPYDAEVFSVTPPEFDAQISFWKSRFHVATLAEAIDLLERPQRHRGTSILITFDDGYLDNFKLAFPILANHGVQGVFFLPTSFVGTNHLPWWDVIAYIVRHAHQRRFRLEGSAFEFNLDGERVNSVIAKVMNLYRSTAQCSSEAFIAQLEQACDSQRPDGSHRCFLNWEEAAAMVHGGMAIGSHGHTHEILSRLPDVDQTRELVTSRSILQEKLGVSIEALSYPVGLPESFSSYTQDAAEKAGYRVAFSFYGGLNRPGLTKRYNVLRHGAVFGRSMARYQLQTALAAVTGTYWF
jgi:peptidoglycan/xylan/chitin deacetylase (PgdA/CDA1 family)